MMQARMIRIAMAALMLCGLGQTARADDKDTEADVRCLMISMSMIQAQSPTLQTAGMMSVMYWMGRLDGRTPDLDLETRLLADIKAMTAEEFRATALRCGTELQARGKFMTDMGQDMKQKGVQTQQFEQSR